MKQLFAAVLAAMLATVALMAYAGEAPLSTGIQAPLPDEDKDKYKDKKDG